MADSISLSGASSVNVGSSITITATGEFGSGYNSYRLYARTSNSKASVSPTYRTGYSSKDDFTTTFSVTGSAAGSETLYVYIQGSTNGTTWTNVKNATKSITVNGSTPSASWTTKPSGASLTYPSSSYLCTTGTASNGTAYYGLSSTKSSMSTTRPTASGYAPGSVTVYFYVKGNSGYNDSAVESTTATISKGTPGWSLSPTTVRGWTYDTKIITISSYSSYSSLTWTTSSSGLDYSTRSGAYCYLSKYSAGLGTLTVKTAADTYYNAVTKYGYGYFYGKPTTRTGLVYTGSAQQLLSSDATYSSSQTFYYKVTTTSSTPSSGYTSGYSSATGTGSSSSDTTYYVHVSTNSGSSGYIGYVTVTITGKTKAEWTSEPGTTSPTYTGTAADLAIAGLTSQGTPNYRLQIDSSHYTAWSTSIPTATNAGTYTWQAYIVGDSSHQDSDVTTYTTTISKYQLNASITLASTMTYNGGTRNLVSSGSVINPGSTTDKGTLYYALGSNGTTAPTSGWSTSIPTGTTAGTYYIWYKVDTNDATNCLSKSATYKGSVIINPKPITITAPTINTATLTYTATDKTLASNGSVSDTTGATFKIGLGSSGSSAPSTWYSSDAITAVNAGTYYVWYKAVLNDSTNYTVDTSNHYLGSKAIGQADLTVTGKSYSVTYGDPTPSDLGPTYSGLKGTDTASGVFSTLPTASTNYDSMTDVADSPVRVTVTPGSTPTNYAVTYVNGSITISKADPSYTAPTYSRPTYNGSAQYICTTGICLDGTISYYASTSSTSATGGSWSTTRPTLTSCGTTRYVWWKITGDGNHNDKAAAYVGTSSYIVQREVTITWGTTSWEYDTNTHSATATCGNVVSGDTCTVSTYSGNSVGPNVGSSTAIVTALSNSNYSIPANPADRTPISITQAPAALTLSSNSVSQYTTQTVTLSSYVSAHTGTCTYAIKTNGTTTASTISGAVVTCGAMSSANDTNQTVVCTITDPGDTNHYQVAKDFTITVQKNAQTITFANSTTSVTYGSTLSVSATVSASHGTTGSLSYSTTGTYTSISGSTLTGTAYSGTSTDTITATAARTTTCSIATKTRPVAVQRRTVTLSWGTITWTYDGATHSTTCYAGNLVGSDSCSVTLTGNSVGKNVGTATVTASSLSNANYALPSSASNTLTINKKELTVTASSHTVTYGAAKPTLTVSYSGFVTGESASNLTTAPTADSDYTSSTPVSSSPVATVASGGVATNYSFKYVNGSITINKASSSGTAPTYSRPTYNGSDQYLCSAASSVVGGTAQYYASTSSSSATGGSWSTSRPTLKNCGTTLYVWWKIVGDANHNDKAAAYIGTSSYIVQKTVSLTWGTVTWTYDGSAHSTTCTAGSLITGDSCTVNLSGNSVGKNVGTATVTASSLSNGNYALPSSTTNTLTINKKELTVTASSHNVTYGDAKPTLSVSYSGFITGESASVLTTAPTASTTYASTTPVSSSPVATTASGGAATNYSFKYVNGSITIAQKTVTLNWGTVSWTYDGSTHSTTCTAGGLVNSDTCTVTLTGNSVGKNVGTATVTASSLSNANYKLPSSNTKTLTISAKTATLSWGTTSWTYDKTAHSTTCSVSNLVTGDSCTVTLSGNSITNYGSTTVTATALSNSNYALPSSPTTTISITKRTVTLSWGTLSWTYDKTAHSTTCTAGNVCSGDTVTVTLTGNSITNVGTATVTASSVSNTNYQLPASNTATLTVTAKEVTLSWGTTSWTYDGSTHSTTCTAGGVISGDTCTVTLTGNSVGKNVGSATVTASSLSNSNYKLPSANTKTISITQKEVTLSWGTHSWTYDKTEHTVTCTAGSLVSGDTCTVTLTNNKRTNAGSQTVTATALSNGNYKLPASPTTTLTISPKTITLSWGTTSWTYDKASHSTTCTAGGVISGDTCTITLTGNSVGPSVGTATVTATAVSNSNYALPSSGLSATLSVTAKEVTLSWGTTSWVYDGSTHSTTCTAGSLISGDTCTVTLTGNSVGKNVSSATVTASSLSNSNYKLPSANTKTISVTQKEVTLSWGTHTWDYDKTEHTVTCTAGSLITGDTCTVTLSNNKRTNAGSQTVTATALSNGNYKLPSSPTTTLTINAKTITLSWGTTSWIYDKSSHSTTCAAGGVISGDTCTITLSGNSVGPSVGSAIVTATAVSNSNYKLPSSGLSNTIYVTAKEVTLSWGATSWVYDGSTHSTTCTAGSLLSGDTCTVTLSGNSVGKNVGSATVTATGLSNSNYKLPSAVTATISITQKTVSITWGTLTWTYDATEKTVTCTVDSSSIVSGDTVTVTLTNNKRTSAGTQTVTASGLSNSNYKLPSTGTTATLTINKRTVTLTWSTTRSWTYDKTAHSISATCGNLAGTDTCTVTTYVGNSITNVGTVTVTATALSNSNYTLPSSASTTMSVTAKTVGLSWGTTTWTYDKTEKTVTCSLTGIISGDSCTLTLTNNKRTNAGTQTVTASSLSNSNYALPASNTTTLTINQKEVTLSWGTLTWVYDGSTHSTSATCGSIISGDTCTVTAYTGNSVGKNVGTSTVTATTLSNSNYKLPSSASATLSITQKEVTLSWGTVTWTYDGNAHSTTCTAGSLVGTDTCTVTLTGNSVGKNVGTATVTASSLSNSNYKLPSSKTKTLTINALTATLSWGATGWTYDGATHSTTCSVGNLVTGDTCNVTLSGNSVGKNVGTATVTATALSNSNYALPSSKTKTLTISARVASFTWGTTSWVYDGSTHSTTCTMSNLVSGDTCTITLSGNSVGANVGSSTVIVTALGNSNYSIPASPNDRTTIKITKAYATITIGTHSTVLDEGDTETLASTVTGGGTITYSSSNPTKATIGSSTGLITAIEEGTTTIRIDAAESTNYYAATTTYILTIGSACNTRIYLDGTWHTTQAYVYIETPDGGVWMKATPYVYRNGWKKA